MSSPPKPESAAPQKGGLGRSTPLVTVANVHSGIRTSTSERLAPSVTPAGTDHPLAAPPAAVELPERSVPESTAAANPPPPKAPVSSPAPTVAKLPPASATPSKKAPASSLDAMADEFMSGPSKRTEQSLPPILKPKPLPKEQQGMTRLHTLVSSRAWGDVLHVCGNMLRSEGSPHAPLYASLVHDQNTNLGDDPVLDAVKRETIEILTLECQAWLKLRRYAELGREVDRWNFLLINDSNATSPSWVPWSLHILAAESLQYTDPSSGRCTDQLFDLRRKLVEQNQNIWLTSIDNALSNAFIRQKKWRLALASLDSMMETLREATKHHVQKKFMVHDDLQGEELESVVDKLANAFRCEILSRQGRVMLQVGALLEASILFEDAKKLWKESCQVILPPSAVDKVNSHWIMNHVPAQIIINDGLLSFAHAEYDQAMSQFRKAVGHLRALHAASTPSSFYELEDWMGPTVVRADTVRTALSHCWNNLSLCALYTCRMQEAVRMMESLIREDPTAFLTERLAFNLCTLYELGSDAAASTRKKRVLQVIAKRFYLHDVGPESFRVN